MTEIKKLFLCHERHAAPEVHALASSLRLRGLVPWVDQHGGFLLGDVQVDRARCVISSECSGLILYATEGVFESKFIGRIEMNEAIRAKGNEAAFLLVALPRRIGFDELSRLSLIAFGINLADIASRQFANEDMNLEGASLDQCFDEVSRDILRTYLKGAGQMGKNDVLSLQFSTREKLPDYPQDVLCIDAVELFSQGPEKVTKFELWERVHAGLADVENAISTIEGRPRLKVHGSKHLTAAFLFGYVFPSIAFDLDVRTKRTYWSTDCPPAPDLTLKVDHFGGSASSDRLHVELSTLDQPVSEAVRRYQKRSTRVPLTTVRITVDTADYSGNMSNAHASALADAVRREIASAVARQPVSEIHIFAAIPQALATMIGQRLNALPPIQLYEYDGHEYHQSYRIGRPR